MTMFSSVANTCKLPEFMPEEMVYVLWHTEFGNAATPRGEDELHFVNDKNCPCHPEMQPVAFHPETGCWFKTLYHRPMRPNAVSD